MIYGFDREFPPFSFEEAQGIPTGFDVDLLKAVLRDKPVKLIMRPLSWDQVLVELSAGNITVTSGMAKTAPVSYTHLNPEACMPAGRL